MDKQKGYSILLSQLIEKSGLSLLEIAERCEKNGQKITSSYLSKLKNGKMPPPSFKVTLTLAKVLEADPIVLLAYGQSDTIEEGIDELKEALLSFKPDYDDNDLFRLAYHICYNPNDIIAADYSGTISFEEFEKLHETIGAAENKVEYISTAEEITSVLKVPVLGFIAAGQPILAEEHIDEWTEVPNMWNLKDGEVFLLKVKGDSMIGSRIYEGDKVLVKIQPEVETGEIAVVNVNGQDATLKRVKKTESGQVILYPDNPKYEPIFIENENARIIGKVIQVMFEPSKNF
ncbi:repressor LexA [Bacillus oleivorans]|uniref:Repressor LexA n=1 Tax=Bacillus oleivorans TaxID=1448271 RepID=A0A285CWH2_9BACI|nr:S24 family peptidase [Bacillus oleivorans]SNX71765.1 repressor LexA [Bacillus oleivorans]